MTTAKEYSYSDFETEMMSTKGNETIWRYLNFSKFVNLLTTESLFFSRSDTFEDMLEGEVNEPTKLIMLEKLMPIFGDVISKLHLKEWEKMIVEMRKNTYVSCWHINQDESALMWKVYSGYDHGILIKTKLHRLAQCLIGKFNPAPVLGKVIYIDSDTDTIPLTDPIHLYFKKSRWYKEESEVRAIIYTWENRGIYEKPLGINIEVDLNSLIEEIIIDPSAPKWFLETVKKVVEKFQLEINVTEV